MFINLISLVIATEKLGHVVDIVQRLITGCNLLKLLIAKGKLLDCTVYMSLK